MDIIQEILVLAREKIAQGSRDLPGEIVAAWKTTNSNFGFCWTARSMVARICYPGLKEEESDSSNPKNNKTLAVWCSDKSSNRMLAVVDCAIKGIPLEEYCETT